MRINVAETINNLDGIPLKVTGDKVDLDGKPILQDMTVGEVIIQLVLTPPPPGEPRLSEKQHLDRFALAYETNKARKANPPTAIEISAETAAELKTWLLASNYHSLVAGPMLKILNGK